MSAGYPVLLDPGRLRVLVVGGGAVAARKVAGLLEAGGRPEVIAPEVGAGLRDLVDGAGLTWRQRTYAPGDAGGFHLVFAATDDAAVNRAVAAEARAAGALASRADAGEDSDFLLPTVVRSGEVVVALATGGASPLLARRLRERLAAVVTPGVGRAAARLAEVRHEVRARWRADAARRRAFWFSLITPEFVDLAVAGRDEEVEQAITRCLSQS